MYFLRHFLPPYRAPVHRLGKSRFHSGIAPRTKSVMTDLPRDSDEDMLLDEHLSLQRLQQQRQRRQILSDLVFEFAGDESHSDNHSGSDGDEDMPSQLIRRLVASASGDSRENDDEDEDDNEDDGEDGEDGEDGDDELGFDGPRGELFRHLANLLRRTPGRDGGAAFADVMQRLVGGPSMFGSFDNEFTAFIDNLNQREDSYLILETLNELSEKLLMMNGFTAERVIPAGKLARALVGIMRDPELGEHLELQLVACRCLYNFLEVNQDFVHDALNNDAVEVLVAKLTEISFIDLTEQALQTLEMISKDQVSHNQIILNNGLKAVMQYLDFLTIHAQRKCLLVVANACCGITLMHFALVKSVFPDISQVVAQSHDPAVIESAWLAISRIITAFKFRPQYLDELFANELVQELVRVIVISSKKDDRDDATVRLSFGSCLSLLRLLIVLASRSPAIAQFLLEGNIGPTIVASLAKYSKLNQLLIEGLMVAPKELLSQYLSFIEVLLPDEPTQEPNIWAFVNTIWPLHVLSFQASMDYELRKLVLININKIVKSAGPDDLANITQVHTVSGIFTSVTNQAGSLLHVEERTDLARLHSSLLLLNVLLVTKSLMTKDSTFVHEFEREGLFNDTAAILSALDPSDSAEISFTFDRYNLDDICRDLVVVATSIESLRVARPDAPQPGMSALHDITHQIAKKEWPGVWHKLASVIPTNVSSFELISSGLIEALAALFADPPKEAYTSFLEVFFSGLVGPLVEKLQECLTRSENFVIVSSGDKDHHTIMAKQIKVQLVSDDVELPPHMRTVILLVHAIATFRSVEAFLKQRFRIFDESEKDTSNTEFLIDGEVIPNDTTIYGAIYRLLQGDDEVKVDPHRIWGALHKVTFRKVSSTVEHDSIPVPEKISDAELARYTGATSPILQVLKALFDMNLHAYNLGVPSVSPDTFTNWKLTVKLNRQLEEPLVVALGTLPGWSIHITKQYPFLFPLETRLMFLQSTSFGYSRLIHHWQMRTNPEDTNQNLQLGRPTRQKVRISRKALLQSAVKVLQMYGASPGILEIEYFDEVGLGLGPTLEFYAAVSSEFTRRKLKLWRDADDGDDEQPVAAPQGLFPLPLDKHQLASEDGRKVLYFFATLGKFIARAMLDSRIVDFNFNLIFLHLVQLLNQKNTKDIKLLVSLAVLRHVDAALAASLDKLKACSADELEAMALPFVLPGHETYELASNGANVCVNINNVDLFISKVVDATLHGGIIQQTKAFMEGFSKVFPINSLVIFSPQELLDLFGSADEDWSYATLKSAINANHGYTTELAAIASLVEILVGFSETEKRMFLQFLTGLPKLPVGGFKALRPPLTVVRKYPEDGLSNDDYLPSVMTCANYLKLPDYSSEKVMRTRLLQAIHEGANSFLLS